MNYLMSVKRGPHMLLVLRDWAEKMECIGSQGQILAESTHPHKKLTPKSILCVTPSATHTRSHTHTRTLNLITAHETCTVLINEETVISCIFIGTQRWCQKLKNGK